MSLAEGLNRQRYQSDDGLVAGSFPLQVRVVTITGGDPYSRGTVLGQITSSRFYTICESTANDGSEEPDAILAEDVDTTNGDVQAHIYISGEFDAPVLTIAPRNTAATIEKTLRGKSIFLKNIDAAPSVPRP